MKVSIYELLGLIKDGKAPKKILFKDKCYVYVNKEKDYYLDGYSYDEALFDSYVITDILSYEVEILETTITYKPDKIEKINIDIFDDNEITTINKMKHLAIKINQIIDWINKDLG